MSINRILGSMMMVAMLVLTYIVLTSFNWSWAWWGSALMTIGLGIWTRKGLKKIEVGWRGQLLWFGQRMDFIFDEGLRWAPFPFGLKLADCRAKTTKLDEMKVFTKDNIEVSVNKPTIVWEVFDPDRYFSMDPAELPRLLDDAVDQNVRKQIRKTLYNNIVGMEFGTSAETLEHWGIRVLKIKVPDILPTDKKLRDNVQLVAAENLERDGQRVEMEHLGNLVSDLQKPKFEGGYGLTMDQAYEAALLITGKADPKKIHGIALDSSVVAAITAVLGRK